MTRPLLSTDEMPLHDPAAGRPFACQLPEAAGRAGSVAYDWRCRGCIVGAMASVVLDGTGELVAVNRGERLTQGAFRQGVLDALESTNEHGFGPQAHPPRLR